MKSAVVLSLVLLAALPAFSAPTPRQDTVVVDPATDAVIRGALKYLAAAQAPDGSWSVGEHRAAITGYALMPFLADGQLPGEGEYGRTVSSGVEFLLACARPDGYIAAPTGQSNMYGHGIATIALAEVYGEDHDARISMALERSVRLIVACQNDAGGWRYNPTRADADISVTVLQLVALRAAMNDGIDVPQETLDRAVGYVKSCRDDATGGFCYQPARQPGFSRTAAAIYSLQVCGLYDDPMVHDGSKYLFDHPDQFFWTYGSFYAAPAQYMIGGDTWRRWYNQVNRILLQHVLKQSGGLCYWSPLEGNRYPVNDIYATSVYTMILAMPYHYIPLYQR